MNIKAAFGIALLACSTGWTADSITPLDVKLGQWETTSTTNTTGIATGIPPEVLDKMPPDQRAKIEERIKASQGPHTTVTQTCLKKEDLDKTLNFGAKDTACTRSIVSSSRGKQEIHIECTRNGSKQTGTLRIEAAGSENIKGSLELAMSGRGAMNISSTFSGKWLGATCKDK
jgi:hypothetical protein